MLRFPRVLAATLAAGALAGGGVAAAAALTAAAPGVTVPAVDVPKRSLTPGAVFRVGITQVCRPGYARRVRNVPAKLKTQAYARYKVRHVPYAHEIDHLISLELGGSNAITNLWPEPYAGQWGARTKDKLEDKLHALVCSGSMTLKAAQHAVSLNWVTSYERYVLGSHHKPKISTAPADLQPGTTSPSTSLTFIPTTTAATPPPATTPTVTDPTVTTPTTTTNPVTTPTPPVTSPTDPVDPGGFYASSYASADTIYCADDSAWHGLSATYLGHYATWADAIYAHPGYHLHQPC